MTKLYSLLQEEKPQQFKGRVTLASVKNFQLCTRDDGGNIGPDTLPPPNVSRGMYDDGR